MEREIESKGRRGKEGNRKKEERARKREKDINKT